MAKNKKKNFDARAHVASMSTPAGWKKTVVRNADGSIAQVVLHYR